MFGTGFFEDFGTANGRVREGDCWTVAAGLGDGNASYRMGELWPNLMSLHRGAIGFFGDAIQGGWFRPRVCRVSRSALRWSALARTRLMQNLTLAYREKHPDLSQAYCSFLHYFLASLFPAPAVLE